MSRPSCRACTGLLAQCSRPSPAATTAVSVAVTAAAVTGTTPAATGIAPRNVQQRLRPLHQSSRFSTSNSPVYAATSRTQKTHQPQPQQQGSKPRRQTTVGTANSNNSSSSNVRGIHGTASNSAGFAEKLGDMARQAVRRTIEPYGAFGLTRSMYQKCTKAAAYEIPEEARKNDTVPTTEDGEEIGVGGGIWHDDFNLLPSFSTWSQVTMLHMYLVLTRIRCFEKDAYKMYVTMLGDHFFQEAEDKMDRVHHLTSRGLRQRHLQDLFMVWRGIIMAYDEGFVRGDAVLAAALWRNVFKARPDVDIRSLAAIVAWMRRSYMMFDRMGDEAIFLHGASGVFSWPGPTSELGLVDMPASKDLGALLQREKQLEEARQAVAGEANGSSEATNKKEDQAASA